MDVKKLTYEIVKDLLPEVGEGTSKTYPFIKTHDDLQQEEEGLYGTVAYTFATTSDLYYDVVISYDSVPKYAYSEKPYQPGDPLVTFAVIDFTADGGYEATNRQELFQIMGTITKILKQEFNRPEVKGNLDRIDYIPAAGKGRDAKPGEEVKKGALQRDELYLAFIKKAVPVKRVEYGENNKTLVFLKEYTNKSGQVNFNTLEVELDKMFDDLGVDINFTKHFKERVLQRGLTEEDIVELMEKIHDKYGDEVADLPKDSNRVFTHLTRLVDISSAMGGYGFDGLRDLYLTTAYKRTSKNEPEFRTNKTSPKLKVTESYKGKSTNNGAPGTFKAKITKAYGGDVTIEKARKFKNRKNATAHDKRQANWFINFHSKNEELNEVGEASATVYPFTSDKPLKQVIDDATAWRKTGSSERYYTEEFKYRFKTDKANYIVTFHIDMEKMTYVNFPGTPNWEPGPPFDTVVQVGFTSEGNLEDEITNLNEQFSVLSTVTAVVLDFVEEFNREGGNVKKVQIAPKDDSDKVTKIDSKRGKFYYAYIKKNLSKIPGYSVREGKSPDGYEYIEIYKDRVQKENVAPNHNNKATPYGSGYKKLKEDKTEDRADFYLDYFTNISPSTFILERQGDDIHISNIFTNRPEGFNDEDIRQIPVDQKMETLLMPHIVSLTGYMVENGLSIDDAPEVHFVNDPINAEKLLGRTAFYDPNEKSITLYVTGRHPKDILRSFAHEMIHYCQDCENRLHQTYTTDINQDDYLRELEEEAYTRGNMYFRSWENSTSEKDIKEYSLKLTESLEELMGESKSRYNVGVKELAKKIFLDWKNQYSGYEETLTYSDNEAFLTSKTENTFYFELDANLTVKKTADQVYAVNEPTGVDPDIDPEEGDPTFTINIQVDPRDLPNKWPEIYYDLVDIIRHEIEHLTHFGPDAIDAKRLPDDKILRIMINADLLPKTDYFRLPAEVDAMLQGLALKARKKREPLRKVIDDYLDTQGITEEEKESIINLWRNRAKVLSLAKF